MIRYIKYIIDLFKSFFLNPIELPEEDLNTPLSESERVLFIRNHKKINPTVPDVLSLSKFIQNVSPLNREFECKFYNGLTEVSIQRHRELKKKTVKSFFNSLITITKNSKNDTWYKIIPFDDDWFITEVMYSNGSASKHWIFKSDTLDGVRQLLYKYKYFNDIGIKGISRYRSDSEPF